MATAATLPRRAGISREPPPGACFPAGGQGLHRDVAPAPCPPRGMKCAGGAADQDGVLRGVAIAGRPVARLFDDGQTLEVTRLTSDGWPNVGSMLYGACARAAFALGYTRLVTYTQR